MILVNGQKADRIAIQDRGLQYGDGLFETIPYKNNTLLFLDDHLSRLVSGCERLQIPTNFIPELENDLLKTAQSLQDDAVVKIIVTRGQGGRGYKQPEQVAPTRIVSTHPYPDYPASNQQGIKVVRCKQIVSQNPTLAGLKHLNRLEQVLARSEWNDTDIAEGLMRNIDGEWIEGTMSNLFIVKQGQLITPDLTLSGVSGVLRKQVISIAKQLLMPVLETAITDIDLADADEAFLTNSIIGIWPIRQIEEKHSFAYGPFTKQFQTSLEDLM